MRKKIVTGMLAAALIFIMTGCCLSHDWQEATCTEPKTCSKCGETEGEALGHTWEEATCTEPKTCGVCKETEGEALGHNLSEATCWEAAVCSVCGETVGDVLPPAFEELGVEGQFMEVGKTYDYNTLIGTRDGWEKVFINWLKEAHYVMSEDGEAQKIEGDYANLEDFFLKGVFSDDVYTLLNEEIVKPTEENIVAIVSEMYNLAGNYEDLTELFADVYGMDINARTTAQATVTDYQVFDSDETHEAKEGYEWKTMKIEVRFSDENAKNYGYVTRYNSDDYYQKDKESGEGNDEGNGEEDSEYYANGWDNEKTHTMNWKGQEYTECRAIQEVEDSGWVEDASGDWSLTQTLKFAFLLPKGYDGQLLSLIDVDYFGTMDNFAYADDNTLFFRLQ
ncbi:MAG: hypothetical protein NC400_07705 [Clostridium sp.]|nr:hypothetical protein [Clostridium sp.]